MSINISLLPWSTYANRWKARMNADAARLLETLGDAAYGTAADLAWREDMGLLRSPDSGHWSRVTLEIGRRLALAEPHAAAPVPQVGAEAWGSSAYQRAA